MLKNNKKITIILTAVILLNFILIGVYVYVVRAIKDKSESTSILSSKLSGYISKEGKINILKKTIEDTSVDRAKLYKYFVDINDIPVFTKRVESLSKISGVDSLVINSLSQKNNILFLDFKTEGSFENTVYLIQLVKNLPFKIDIKKSYISKIKNINNKAVVDKWEGIFSIEIIGFLNN